MAFEETRAALAVFDQGQPARDHNWDRAETADQVEFCRLQDQTALTMVRQAFWRDTRSVNSWGHCRAAPLEFMRRMAEKG